MNPIRYRGYYYDVETGFYYLNSRYYDSGLGRFLNADDMAFLGASGTVLGYNLYGYCENEPVMRVDCCGEAWWFFVPVVIGGFSLFLTGCSNKSNNKPKAYRPVYNKFYIAWPEDMLNYNCYAYSIGVTSKRINPGYYSDRKFKLNLNTIKNNTIADLKKLGYKSKTVAYNYRPKARETMIALRIGPTDYHFMKRQTNTGYWFHKPGKTSIIRLIGNPWDYDVWYSEYYTKDGWGINKNIYYNSKIIYIVYWKE